MKEYKDTKISVIFSKAGYLIGYVLYSIIGLLIRFYKWLFKKFDKVK